MGMEPNAQPPAGTLEPTGGEVCRHGEGATGLRRRASRYEEEGDSAVGSSQAEEGDSTHLRCFGRPAEAWQAGRGRHQERGRRSAETGSTVVGGYVPRQ